ncbi:MAG: Fpg/Nei family DNA glycosylase [Polyangiaceae bacterium]|nr:Fpg/Nei family DNA glycosylase [Polyangiaceae bacterium]NUQ72309.1 Fpg/Nei family DNA glycosylase [Polyangiaceae bacterium]
MPEGDTIFRAAQALSKAIGGKRIRAARSPLPALTQGAESLAGHTVLAVEAHGKHLLIRFDDGRALHSHMRMTGSWHIYRPGEAWQKPVRAARFVIETDDFVAVCFNAPVVDLVRTTPKGAAVEMERLGPDLLKDNFDQSEAARRLRARPEMPVGEAVLDQSAIAGIGNIYKSETLFVCRVSPFAPVGSLPDETLAAIVATARELMSKNLGAGPRTTRFRTGLGGPGQGRASRYWVYKRSGDPCLVCGSPIAMRRQGLAGRSTYFCPRCQDAPPARSAKSAVK